MNEIIIEFPQLSVAPVQKKNSYVMSYDLA